MLAARLVLLLSNMHVAIILSSFALCAVVIPEVNGLHYFSRWPSSAYGTTTQVTHIAVPGNRRDCGLSVVLPQDTGLSR